MSVWSSIRCPSAYTLRRVWPQRQRAALSYKAIKPFGPCTTGSSPSRPRPPRQMQRKSWRRLRRQAKRRRGRHRQVLGHRNVGWFSLERPQSCGVVSDKRDPRRRHQWAPHSGCRKRSETTRNDCRSAKRSERGQQRPGSRPDSIQIVIRGQRQKLRKFDASHHFFQQIRRQPEGPIAERP